ncbi:MAG: hypothetical protein ACPGJV_13365 [Bacteriovoracaceae bacterium]
MAQALLISNNEELIDLYTINLKIYAATDIVSKPDIEKATSLLKVFPNIGLIISNLDHKKDISSLIDVLQECSLNIPILQVGGAEDLDELSLSSVKNPSNLKKVLENVHQLLGIDPAVVPELPFPNYIPISLQTFIKFGPLSCDLYVKISKSQDDFRFLKRFRKEETLTSEDVKAFKERGINELYIKKEDRFIFTETFSKKIIAVLDSSTATVAELPTDFTKPDLEKIIKLFK